MNGRNSSAVVKGGLLLIAAGSIWAQQPYVTTGFYLAGSGRENATAIAVDTSGSIYVALNLSASAPLWWQGYWAPRGGSDAAVVKLAADGRTVQYSVQVGGVGDDRPSAIALDAQGRLWIAGTTLSRDFPVTAGAVQLSPGGAEDAFVVCLDSVGRVIFSTYLGGAGTDQALGLAVDSAGSVYVAGQTSSANFPVTVQAAQGTIGGGADGFLVRISAIGVLDYSTFLGGAGVDVANAVKVAADRTAWVVGSTSSPGFPANASFVAGPRGGADGFLIAVTPTGNGFGHRAIFAGTGQEEWKAVEMDASNAFLLAGSTSSMSWSGSASAEQIGGSGYDAVVCRYVPGSGITWVSRVGGSGAEGAVGLWLEDADRLWVAGSTSSTNLPVRLARQAVYSGQADGWVGAFSLSTLRWQALSYMGGSGDDWVRAAAGRGKRFLVAGSTTSSGLPVTPGSVSTTPGLDTDGYIAAYSLSTAPVPVSVTPSSGNGAAGAFEVLVQNPSGASALASIDLVISKPAGAASACHISWLASDGSFSLWNDAEASKLGALTSGQNATLENSQCRLHGVGSGSSASGSDRRLIVQVTFKPAFAAASAGATKAITIRAVDGAGNDSGYRELGQWTVRTKSRPPFDLDGNGSPELIWQNEATRQVAVYYMSGSRSETYSAFNWLDSGGAAGWTVVSMADFDGNGKPDLLWQNDTTRDIAIWYLGGPNGNQPIAYATMSVGSSAAWQLVGAADLDGNGKPDLVWQNMSTGQVAAWYMSGPQGTVFQSFGWLSSGLVQGWNVVALADLDGNGKPDLIWQNTTTREVTGWLMGGPLSDTWVTSVSLAPMVPGWTLIGLVDLDGNEKADLIWQNDTTRQVVAWYMGGANGDWVIQYGWLCPWSNPGWKAISQR